MQNTHARAFYKSCETTYSNDWIILQKTQSLNDIDTLKREKLCLFFLLRASAQENLYLINTRMIPCMSE